MRGARRLKSRVAAVPGGMIAAGQAGVGRQLEVGDAAPVGGHDRPAEVLDVGVHVEDRQARRARRVSCELLRLAGVLEERCRYRASVRLRWRASRAEPGDVVDEVGRREDRRSAASRRRRRRRPGDGSGGAPSSAAATASGVERVDGDRRGASSGGGPRGRASSTQRYSVARARTRSVWLTTPTSVPAASTTGRPLTWWWSISSAASLERARPRGRRSRSRAMTSATVGSCGRSVVIGRLLPVRGSGPDSARRRPVERRGDVDEAVVGGSSMTARFASTTAPPRLPKNRPRRSRTARQERVAVQPGRAPRTARPAGRRRRGRRPASGSGGPGAGRGRRASAAVSSAVTRMRRARISARAAAGIEAQIASGSVSGDWMNSVAAVDEAGQRVAEAERGHVVERDEVDLIELGVDADRARRRWSGSRSSAGPSSRSRSAGRPGRACRTARRRASRRACWW